MYPGSEGEERRPGYKAIQVHEITQIKFNDTSHDRLYYARFSRPSLARSYYTKVTVLLHKHCLNTGM